MPESAIPFVRYRTLRDLLLRGLRKGSESRQSCCFKCQYHEMNTLCCVSVEKGLPRHCRAGKRHEAVCSWRRCRDGLLTCLSADRAFADTDMSGYVMQKRITQSCCITRPSFGFRSTLESAKDAPMCAIALIGLARNVWDDFRRGSLSSISSSHN